LPGVYTVLFGIPRELERCSVEFHAAAGPWQTVGTNDGKSPVAVGSGVGPSYIFGEAVAGKDRTTLTVSHDIGDQSVRIVAIDRAGRECRPARTQGSGASNFHQTAATFDLGPEAIREYRLQARPYQRADIPGVAARPRGK